VSHVRSLFLGGPLAEIGRRTLEAFQQRRPSEIIWNIPNRCNLFCKHCYVAADFHQAEAELTTHEALDLVRQIGEAKVPLLFLTGGEPFLRPDLFQILAKAQGYGIRVVMSTNGLLIDDAAAASLARFDVDYVAISLYGPEAFHDDYVGAAGSFRRVVENIGRLRRHGIKVGVKDRDIVFRREWKSVTLEFENLPAAALDRLHPASAGPKTTIITRVTDCFRHSQPNCSRKKSNGATLPAIPHGAC